LLAEIVLNLFAGAPYRLRRMGLVRESVGLWSRAARQRTAWSAHEARCHGIVARAVEGLAQCRTVIVLGSGLARDVPVDLLAARFSEVLLVDAVHLPTVRLRLRRLDNVRFDTRDLSGIAGWLQGEATGRADPVTDLAARDDVDLVISANLLSQLPIAPLCFLEDHPRRAAGLPPDVATRTVAWHLADLARFRARVCLLTDVEMREEDRAGRVTERLDLMRGVTLPKPDERWDWEVAPFGEASRTHRYVHRAQGYADFRQG